MQEKMLKVTQPIHGVGIGLRAPHCKTILAERPKIPWFEVLTDNYLNHHGLAYEQLLAIRRDYPMVLHGVGLSLGSSDPLNQSYLQQLRALAQEVQPAWISDHLSWVSIEQNYFPQLLPLPYTNAVIDHVVARIQQVQEYLSQPILVENVSSYLDYSAATMPEWEFLNTIAQRSGCGLLLDINNIYVSSVNTGFDPDYYLQQIEPSLVKQFHLAGFQDHQNYLLDSHDAPVSPAVWKLFATALQHFGAIPTLIEWDAKIPEFSILFSEAKKAEAYLNDVALMERNGIKVIL